MTHTPLPPFAATSGSKTPRMVLVGEAWGGNEAELKRPFVGEAGKELWRMLGEAMPEIEPGLHARVAELHKYGLAWVRDREAWLEAAGIAMTNVLALRPPENRLEALCDKKKEVGGDSYHLPSITKGKYLKPEFLPEVDRLFTELAAWQPNLVVAFGNTACWGVLRATNIGSIRGAITRSIPFGGHEGLKVLPTYHPAGVLRNWAWRPIVVADLMKAGREAGYPEIRRPQRRVLVSPTLAEIESWLKDWMAAGCPLLACDTETEAGQIKCIGFAWSPDYAIVIPFLDKAKPGWSYWDEAEERAVWMIVKGVLEHRACRLLGQNFVYDAQYLMPMTIRPKMAEDTMLLHHALFPELQKGLGFLGSIYTNEASWKLMRRERVDTEKRDE